jgi:hypothetical protein
MTTKSVEVFPDTLLSLIGHTETSDPGPFVLWEVSLSGQMLAMFPSQTTAIKTIAEAQDSANLYSLVNDRCEFLRNSETFTAQMVKRQIELLHNARAREMRHRAVRGHEKFVHFFLHGLYWETYVTDGECEADFFCATEPHGKWVDAADLLETSNTLFESVYDEAVSA